MEISDVKSRVLSAFAEVPKPNPNRVYSTLDSDIKAWQLERDAFHIGLAGKDWRQVDYRSAIGVRPDVLHAEVYRFYVQAQLLGDFGCEGPGIGPLDAGLTRWETVVQSDGAIRNAVSAPPIDSSTKFGLRLSEALASITDSDMSPAAYLRQCRYGESTFPLYFREFENLLSETQLRAVSLYVRLFAETGERESAYAYKDYWKRFDTPEGGDDPVAA